MVCDLGLAFQLTNIARDIIEDAHIGRCYLPAQWLEEAGIPRQEMTAPRHREALAGLGRAHFDQQSGQSAPAGYGTHSGDDIPLAKAGAKV